MEAVAAFDERYLGGSSVTLGIVRNRGKIEATIANVRAAPNRGIRRIAGRVHLAVRAGQNAPAQKFSDLPASTAESTALSRDLRKRGFRFVGPTTVYAAMQALGVVNDHLAGCASGAAADAERVLP